MAALHGTGLVRELPRDTDTCRYLAGDLASAIADGVKCGYLTINLFVPTCSSGLVWLWLYGKLKRLKSEKQYNLAEPLPSDQHLLLVLPLCAQFDGVGKTLSASWLTVLKWHTGQSCPSQNSLWSSLLKSFTPNQKHTHYGLIYYCDLKEEALNKESGIVGLWSGSAVKLYSNHGILTLHFSGPI
jgi:hypothetical protein